MSKDFIGVNIEELARIIAVLIGGTIKEIKSDIKRILRALLKGGKND